MSKGKIAFFDMAQILQITQIRGDFSWAKAKNYIELKESKKKRKIRSKGFCMINKKSNIYKRLTLN